MGSSNKKKKERAKDFAKPKLKVGKTKPKASNFTNTSFKAKAIALASQSLHTSAPTISYLFFHHLSLLKHHSASTRKESLSYLTTHLPRALSFPREGVSSSATASTAIPATATLILALMPLILDSTSSVRSQLLTLLKTLPEDQVKMHAGKVMLYVNSAMTHISEDVRGDSTKFLSWILSVAPEEVFCAGGWGKGLWGLIGLLGWGGSGPGEAGKVNVPQGKDRKVISQHLAVLKDYISAGIIDYKEEENAGEEEIALPHWSTGYHMLPSRSNAYAYLNLFSTVVRSNVGISGVAGVVEEPEDLDARRRYLLDGPGKGALGALRVGLEGLRKEEGELGRIAGRVSGTLEEGLITRMGREE